MKTWAFDWLGGIASEQFDINHDGLQFVFTILGFLWMNEEQLGFDPTIMTANNGRFIEIKQDGSTERIIIDGLMTPGDTACHKDSWQYSERDEEGDLVREATGKGAVNEAWYHHHEIVPASHV
ncbi:hypothetical protein EDB80DRAFT_833401 [Ilyonectria destructans]|nr:hypothetical protein EDB80DRAFT_833401 [Ilyonectria destructans]